MFSDSEKWKALADAVALTPDTNDQYIQDILDAVREIVGSECISVAVDDGLSENCLTWTSSEHVWPAVSTECLDAAVAVCNGEEHNPSQNTLVVSIKSNEAHSAAFAILRPADEKSVPVVSSMLAVAIDNLCIRTRIGILEEQTAKRIAEVAAVYEIGQAINEVDLDRLLSLITEKAAGVMDAQACSLMLRDIEQGHLTIVASHGLTDDVVRGAKVAVGEGIAGRVAETGQAMLIVDVESDSRFLGTVKRREGIAASICAPLRDESGRIIGVLTIRRHIPAPVFTEEDLRLFCVFASQAALAISNAKLYTDLSRRIAEMSTISDLLKAINSTLNLDFVLNEIADSIVNVVGFDRCCLYLAEPRSGVLIASLLKGYSENDLPKQVARGEGVIGLVASEAIPIYAHDATGYGSAEAAGSGKMPFLATPIVVRQECIGVVVVDNSLTRRTISPPEVELLSTFVNQAGIAIENARLYEAMEQKYSELNVLFEHSKTISSAYGLENVAHIATAVARKGVQCDGCMLLVLGEKRSNIALQAATGLSKSYTDAINRAFSESDLVELVRETRNAQIIAPNMMPSSSTIRWHGLVDCMTTHGSALVVPLLTEDATIGAFILVKEDKPEFSTADLQLLSIVASQAAVVIKNALRYEQRTQKQVFDLSMLYEFSRRISASSSLEEALDAILLIISDLVDCDESAIYALDQNSGALVVTNARDAHGKARTSQSASLDESSVVSWTLREHKAVVSPDITADQRFLPMRLCGKDVRSLMSIPLMVQDEAVGVLCVGSSSPNLYSEDDVRTMSIIASQSAAIYKELEALAALTSYTDNILSSIAAGVITVDSEGTVLTWNRAAEEITGVSVADACGCRYADILRGLPMAHADRTLTIQIIEKVRMTGETYHGYKLCYHPDDSDPMYINLSASVLYNSTNERIGLVIIFEDITKQINMEDQFRRMGELAAVGQLAASIAHELRNPLSSIKGAAQFLQNEYENDEAITEFLGIIVDEVNGLSKLTTEFLEFARPVQLELATVNVNDVIRKTVNFMGADAALANIRISDQLSERLPTIQADEKQLEQVLRNLIINAVQAMPDGGQIHIATETIGNRAVALSVSDNGMGIPDDKLPKIFIPFFTTKTKGTGLGLSVVQKIIDNHGGHIELSSQVGEGTAFKIVLPLVGVVRTMPSETDTIERRI